METIKIKDTKINLNFETQVSPNGRPFRLSSTKKNLQQPSKWVDRVERWYWIYEFKYLDEQGGFFAFEYDYNDKLIGKL